MLVSVCGTHRPAAVSAELAPGEAFHLTADELVALRADASAHIGACSRGPIVSVPVHIVAGPASAERMMP